MFIQNRLGMIEGTETLLAQEHRLDQISNNLANVDTTGYKKETITFWETMFKAADSRTRVGKGLRVVTNHGQGSLSVTNNTLDFAIEGEGFFRIQTPNGIRYTRNGNFTLNGQGQLSTHNGELVLGDGGPIVLDDDKVHVSRNGEVIVNGETVNRLGIVSFANLEGLEKEGNNLYRPKDATINEQPVELPHIEQGFLETSNVNNFSEMIEMIDLQKAYQSQQKAIQTTDDIDQQSTSRVGKLA